MSKNIKINFGLTNAARNVDIFGDFVGDMKDLAAEMPLLEKKALNVGAYVLKEEVKRNMISRWPAAGRAFRVKRNGYVRSSVPIAESAAMQGKPSGGKTVVYISGKPQEAGYIAKMYNVRTKDRIQRKRNGKPLRKSINLRSVGGLRYFESGIAAGEEQCYDAMERILMRKISNLEVE